jgi:hypothetical protein
MASKNNFKTTNSANIASKELSDSNQESNELNREPNMNDQATPPAESEQLAQLENVPSAPDFSRFRLSQNFGSLSGVKKKLTTVPVRKPNKTQFVRVRTEGKLDAMLLKYPADSEDLYLIEPDVIQEVGNLANPYRLVQAIDRQDNVFIWPLAIPGDANPRNWYLSALEAAGNAELEWVRMQANKALQAYDIFAAVKNLGEPEWPELSMNELLEIAFKNKIIDRPDHLVLRQLRGAA